MPVIIVTTGEIFQAAIHAARDASAKIFKLSDLDVSPLTPGETVDMRRHQIAKLGKQLAEAFVAMDDIMLRESEARAQHSDVTANAPTTPTTPSEPDPNSN